MRITITFCLSLLAFIGFGQKPHFKNYTVDDGLISSAVYQANQDSEGFIWFSTETGVSRFDGKEFVNFTRHEGLADNEIFKSFEDSQKRVWFLSFNGSMSFYHAGGIYNAKDAEWLKSLSFKTFLLDAIEDKDGRVWFSSKSEGIKYIDKENKVTEFTDKTGTFNNVLDFRISGDTIIGIKNRTVTRFYDGKLVDVHPTKFTHFARDNSPNASSGHSFETWSSGFYLKKDGKRQRLPLPSFFIKDNALCLLESQDATMWVGTRGDGLLQIPNYKKDLKITRHLEGTTILNMLQDSENNLWVCTQDKGVFFMSVHNFLTYQTQDGLSHRNTFALAKESSGRIAIGTSDGSVNFLEPKTGKITYLKLSEERNGYVTVHDIIEHVPGALLVGSDLGFHMIKDEASLPVADRIGACKDLEVVGDLVFAGTSNGLYKVRLDSQNTDVKKVWNQRVTCLQKSENQHVLVGTLNGLFDYDIQNSSINALSGEHYEQRITAIKSYRKNTVLGTYGNGVVVINEAGDASTIDDKIGLLSNFVRSIEIDSQGILWLCTDKGINRIDGFLSDSPKVTSYTRAHGLFSHITQSSLRDGDFIYVATSDGLSFFDINHPGATSQAPRIYLTSLSVNYRTVDILPEMTFSHNENSLELSFTGISFSSVGDISYSYRLLGTDDKWRTSKNTTISYPSLGPGKYRFEVKAVSRSGEASHEPASLEFTIAPHLTDTLGFKIAVGVLILALIASVILLRINSVQRKAAINQKFSQLEHKALMTQMNPHFIFNTMSSIQQFINLNDKRAANRYLSKFADLMRKILNNSRKNTVSIEEELSALDVYLELECLRFNNKFSYELVVNQNVEKEEFMIPTMLIQPYVENSILHGLSTMEDKPGTLLIEFTAVDENLVHVLIKDNGIGREKAMEIKGRRHIKHESTAMKNIEERIALFNSRSHSEQFTTKVTDLVDEDGNAAGTQVELTIPYTDHD